MFHSTNTCRPKCDRLFCLLSSSLNAQPFVCLAPLFALYRSCSQGTFLLCLALRQIPFIVTVEQMEESGRFLSRYYVINDWLPTRSAVCSCDRNMSAWCQVFNAEKTELHPAIPGIIIGCKEANVHKGHCTQTRHLNRVQSTNRFSWCTGSHNAWLTYGQNLIVMTLSHPDIAMDDGTAARRHPQHLLSTCGLIQIPWAAIFSA